MRKSFPLRISQELWEDVQRWAKDELRSVNGQIEYLLREAVKKRKRGDRDRKKRAPHTKAQRAEDAKEEK